ncbi:facilitated trehalose transporter Tret1-like isoform X1 [Penaeus monodon]|uniref:facilitated trehalose transporter Tret1-like isoform X1 n=2 Tax=Penaeus monodon TaxID=6687 RepID=UPI0018A6DF28|nr:facilitated trehalose transporter Tret1-like isoform X1 [Penaeus monodon]
MDVYTVEEHGESSAGRGGRESSAERRTRLLRQGLKMFMCSLAMWTMGSMYVFPSVLAHDLAAHNTTIYGSPITLTSSQVDMAGSLVMLGSTVGAWVVAPLMMRLGRRACILGSGSTAVLGWLGVALLPEPVGILVARGLSGMAAGGLSLVANSYGIELADPEVRGMMAMVLNLGILLGQVVTVSVGYDARYFIVALVDMALPLALLLSLFHLPESPPYLVLKGREGEAREVLLDLRGRCADLEGEIQSYKDLNRTSESKGVWRDLLRPEVLKDLAVVSTLFILMYFTGYQVISANTSRMFEAAGSSLDDSLATIIVNVVQVAAAVAASLLMDRLGRRRSTMLSYGVMCAALGGLAVYLLAAGEQDPRPLAWVPLVCLMVTQGAVTVGVNPVPFILSSEYFPTRIRAWAAGICYTVGNLAGFLALQLYTPMLEALGQVGLYAFYSAVCLAGVPFTYFFVRETTGAKVG